MAGRDPDADWSVRDLVNHLVGEDLWAPPLLAGSTIAEVGDRFADAQTVLLARFGGRA